MFVYDDGTCSASGVSNVSTSELLLVYNTAHVERILGEAFIHNP
ncbi:MAG: hypothetical protein WCI00_08150 [bacterium]